MPSYQAIKEQFEEDFAKRTGYLPREIPAEYQVLLDLQAWEIANLHTAVEGHRRKQIKELRRYLSPDLMDIQTPAHGIAHASPAENEVILIQDKTFALDHLGSKKISKFSPIISCKLFPLNLRFWSLGDTIFETKQALDQGIARITLDTPLHPGEMWIGMQLNGAMESLEGVRFFLDWPDLEPERKATLVKSVPAIRWYAGNQLLTTSAGFGNPDGFTSSPAIDKMGMRLAIMEKKIIDHYHSHFVRIENKKINPRDLLLTPPEPLTARVDPEQWEKQFNESLVWIRILFPARFSPEDIRATRITTNAFPVCNRWIPEGQDFMIQKMEHIKCLTKDQEGHFLGIQRIWSQHGRFRPAMFQSFGQSPKGTYAIQEGGVEKFSPKDALENILHIQQLMTAYQEAFGPLERDKVHGALQNLEKGFRTLSDAVSRIPKTHRQSNFYLHIKAHIPKEQVMLRYWLTEGGDSLNIKGKTALRQLVKDHNLMNNSFPFFISA